MEYATQRDVSIIIRSLLFGSYHQGQEDEEDSLIKPAVISYVYLDLEANED